MKLLTRLVILPILIFPMAGCLTLNHPYVRIGASQSEIRQGIENGKAGLNLPTGKDQDPNLKVSAGFEKGICNRIKYTAVGNRKISDQEVSLILCLNSRGIAWIVQEFPKEEGKVYYRSADGRYRAVLTNRNKLLIFTETLFRKTMSEVDAENQKSKAVN
jgi:hypothetical protein